MSTNPENLVKISPADSEITCAKKKQAQHTDCWAGRMQAK